MKASFRFTRQTCGPHQDLSIHLQAKQASEFSVGFSAPLVSLPQPLRRAVEIGIGTAYSAQSPTSPVAVTVTSVVDHSGSSSELTYKICGEAAMYHLLGFPEKAPFPGFVLDEA